MPGVTAAFLPCRGISCAVRPRFLDAGVAAPVASAALPFGVVC